MPEPLATDFLVIGSGIAGLWFALQAARAGRVLVVTKKEDSESNTNYAQGGIAAVIDKDDSTEMHFADTIRVGDGLCHEDAVRIMVEQGPVLVRELAEVGIRFTRTRDRRAYDLGQEGGHSRRRIVHAKDYTGAEVEKGLIHALVRTENVTVLENHQACALLVSGNACSGALVANLEAGEVRPVHARSTLLATGGLGQVYLHTTNPRIATGDGIAMAFRAGARIANMEFIQFHPTTLFGPRLHDRALLISEAARGEGAILRTLDGRTFMERYHPAGCMAPRDVIARAIENELKTRQEDYVLLDLVPIGAERIRERFPSIYRTCLGFGFDVTRAPIPVVPAAHYVCGGVAVDTWGQTSIAGLFAAGECSATGVHGANRLASNSLLEALVFAHRAAERAAGYQPRPAAPAPSEPWQLVPDAGGLAGLTDRLRRIMWHQVAIVRTTGGLETARAELAEIGREVVRAFGPPGTRMAPDVEELRNMLLVCQLIVRCARTRRESRGLHFLADLPEHDDRFRSDTVVALRDGPLD